MRALSAALALLAALPGTGGGAWTEWLDMVLVSFKAWGAWGGTSRGRPGLLLQALVLCAGWWERGAQKATLAAPLRPSMLRASSGVATSTFRASKIGRAHV